MCQGPGTRSLPIFKEALVQREADGEVEVALGDRTGLRRLCGGGQGAEGRAALQGESQ